MYYKETLHRDDTDWCSLNSHILIWKQLCNFYSFKNQLYEVENQVYDTVREKFHVSVSLNRFQGELG